MFKIAVLHNPERRNHITYRSTRLRSTDLDSSCPTLSPDLFALHPFGIVDVKGVVSVAKGHRFWDAKSRLQECFNETFGCLSLAIGAVAERFRLVFWGCEDHSGENFWQFPFLI